MIHSSTKGISNYMIYEVKMYVGGRVFIEEVHATSPKDAREAAIARNPSATVMGVNPTLR